MKSINFKESSNCQVDFFKKNKNYNPISCDIYDHLEIWSMKGTTLAITFEINDLIKVITTQIKTLTTHNTIEYLITTEDERIRLDHIHSIKE